MMMQQPKGEENLLPSHQCACSGTEAFLKALIICCENGEMTESRHNKFVSLVSYFFVNSESYSIFCGPTASKNDDIARLF